MDTNNIVQLIIDDKIFHFIKSNNKDKKLMTLSPKGKMIHFGDNKRQHYYDRTRIWGHLDHNNKERRRLYHARAKGIKDKYGNLTYKDPESPNYYSFHVLW